MLRPFLWRYLLPASGKALYVGRSGQIPPALARHLGSCDTMPPSPAAENLARHGARYDVIVYDGGDRVDDGLLVVLLSLAAPAATLVVFLSTPGVVRRLVSPIAAATLMSRLRRLLRRAGFSICELFWFRDGFLPPRLYAMTRVGGGSRPAADECSPLAWYLRPRAVALAARRGPEPVLGEHEIVCGRVAVVSDAQPLAAAWIGSGNVHRLECADAIVRLPLTAEAVPRCQNNFSTLQSLARLKLSFATPEPLATFEYRGLPCFVESRVPGHAMDVRLAPRFAGRFEAAATTALIELQRRTRRDEMIDKSAFERLVLAPMDRLAPSLPADLVEALRAIQAQAWAVLSGGRLPVVQLHGDFKGANLLWTQDGRLASVVDWDLGAPDELPVVDFLFFAAYEASARTRCSFGEALASAGDPERSGDYQRFAFQELGLSRFAYAFCGLMALIRYGNLNAGFHSADSRSEWCRVNLNAGVRQMIGALSALAHRARKVA